MSQSRAASEKQMRGDAKLAEVLICASADLRQKVRCGDSGGVSGRQVLLFSCHSRAGDSRGMSETVRKALLAHRLLLSFSSTFLRE